MERSKRDTLIDTLLYFSVNRRLATREEIFRYQVGFPHIDREEIPHLAAQIPDLQIAYGLYGFAKEFEELRVLRQEKVRETLRRFRRIKRYGRVLISIPFVRGVFVAGSLTFSTGNAKRSSDIDLFVVTEARAIWLSRFLMTVVTQLLGVRRRGDYDENLFCLNHYITTESLARFDHDVYAAELYSDYIAIGQESQELLQKFWTTNSWTHQFFPQNTWRAYRGISDLNPYPGKQLCERFLRLLGSDWWNWILGKVQKHKILSNPLTSQELARIKATDTELEFHPKPNAVRIEQAIQTKRNALQL